MIELNFIGLVTLPLFALYLSLTISGLSTYLMQCKLLRICFESKNSPNLIQYKNNIRLLSKYSLFQNILYYFLLSFTAFPLIGIFCFSNLLTINFSKGLKKVAISNINDAGLKESKEVLEILDEWSKLVALGMMFGFKKKYSNEENMSMIACMEKYK